MEKDQYTQSPSTSDQPLKATTNEEKLVSDLSENEYRHYLEQQEAHRKEIQQKLEEEAILWREERERLEIKRKERLRRLGISSALLGIGSLFVLSAWTELDFINFLFRYQGAIAGIAFISAAFLYLLWTTGLSSNQFRDVDLRRRYEKVSVKKVQSPADAYPFPTREADTDDDKGSQSDVSDGPLQIIRNDPFYEYFIDLKETLEAKAFDAEEKASILLDKGTSYTKWGILFFIASIVAWQLAAWMHGFKTEFIYGIASCSGLFIFIEFLSAWFLKQYRHYVDTSTYLLKVKAIFDRYLLVYLASGSLSPSSLDQQRHTDMLIEMLGQDIRWPETYLLKNADVGFAHEATSAISSLVKEMRAKRKSKKT